MFGVPCFRWIPAHSRVEARYCAALPAGGGARRLLDVGWPLRLRSGRCGTGRPEDLERVAEIQAHSPEAARWNPRDYLEHDFRVVEREGSVAGFVVAREVAEGECEMLNLAVAPEYAPARGGQAACRRHGAAATRGPCTWRFASPTRNARSFYKSFGFEEVGSQSWVLPGPPGRGRCHDVSFMLMSR